MGLQILIGAPRFSLYHQLLRACLYGREALLTHRFSPVGHETTHSRDRHQTRDHLFRYSPTRLSVRCLEARGVMDTLLQGSIDEAPIKVSVQFQLAIYKVRIGVCLLVDRQRDLE